MDLFPWDLARFGNWASKPFTKARAFDQYSHRFKIHFPYEERGAGRPMKTRPAYERQKALGAVFGLSYGYEHPLWFAGEGVERAKTMDSNGKTVSNRLRLNVRRCARQSGVIDVSNFAKYEIRGDGSEDYLNRLVANYVPTEIGRSCLTPMLGARGGIAGDFTITKLEHEHYLMIGSGIAERYHQRYFNAVSRPASVRFESLTEAWGGFNVAGPNSRELLSRLTDTDLSDDCLQVHA